LHAVLLIEQDQLVWQSCLEAVQADGHDEAAQLALLAVHHTWPDIRRLGVAYIALHPTPEAAGWLMPLFRDDNRTVQEAAIAAAAKCGNPVVLDGYPAADDGGPTGLRPLLTSADHELRWTVLETMAALRDDQAAAELIRLSYDPHSKVREQAARTMGQTGDPRFVESLIRWSWTESADPVKQSILASLDALTPPVDRPESPSGLAAPPTIDDKIKHWAAWWERHPPRTEAASPRSAAPESQPTS
jgi:HEAT repeat protein